MTRLEPALELKISLEYFNGTDGITQSYGDPVITDKISGRSEDRYQKDYLLTLNRPNAGDSVRVKVIRTHKDNRDASNEEKDNILLTNEFSWSSMTEIKYAKLRYPNSALVALRVEAEQFKVSRRESILSKASRSRFLLASLLTLILAELSTQKTLFGTARLPLQLGVLDPAFILYDLLTNTRYGFGNFIDTQQLDKYRVFCSVKILKCTC